ncbi:MAG: serine hydrolase domain-containing protein [Planctomycetota bacterium]|jgi:CubicO group peptidase (beta-lactamase class C family)
MRCSAAVGLIVLVLGAVPGRAEDDVGAASPERVDALLAPIRERHAVPALGGAIVDLDGLAAIGVTGRRVADRDVAVSIDDRWHLGSCTKAMTATLLGVLHERDELSLDATLGRLFADLPTPVHEDYRSVTLRALLAHVGGAPADLRAGGLWRRLGQFVGPARWARALLTRVVLSQGPAAPPGTTFLYSNGGYAIAGHAAEQRTSTAWEELLRRELFRPLGMERAGFGAPGDAEALDHPWGHRPADDGPRPVPPGPGADNPPAIGPAGTVHATLGDWARFVRLHLRGAQPDAEGLLLSRDTFRALHAPPVGGDYALGWGVTTRAWAKGADGTGRVLTHAGSNTIWFAVAWLAPEKGFAVLATCNQGGEVAAKACDDVAWTLIRHRLR